MNQLSISAVLPAYNEEGCIAKAILAVGAALRELAPDHEIIVVDDGSSDTTAQITLSLAKENPAVRLVQHTVNQGYGAALATGFAAATKSLVFLTDADLQFEPAEIGKLVQLINNGADLAVGYRAKRRDPRLRRFYGWCWNRLIALLFGRVVRDADCAFKLFRREIFQKVQLRSNGVGLSAEFLIKAKRAGYTIAETPVTHLPRRSGRAACGRISVVVKAIKELIWLRLWGLT